MARSKKQPFISPTELAVGITFETMFADLGVCPCLMDIAAQAGVSRETVHRCLLQLVALGFYDRVPRRHRSYSILKPVPRPVKQVA